MHKLEHKAGWCSAKELKVALSVARSAEHVFRNASHGVGKVERKHDIRCGTIRISKWAVLSLLLSCATLVQRTVVSTFCVDNGHEGMGIGEDDLYAAGASPVLGSQQCHSFPWSLLCNHDVTVILSLLSFRRLNIN